MSELAELLERRAASVTWGGDLREAAAQLREAEALRARVGAGEPPLGSEPSEAPPQILIARCGAGRLGIVTGREVITYPDGERALAYTGTHITPAAKLGESWSSRRPEWLTPEEAAAALVSER